jgi:hypothetical protein
VEQEIDGNWNEDFEDEVSSLDASSLVVYSRDWTVETVINQIEQGNIDLNPKFQRRNAWADKRRSRLIESLLIGIPVPEIVLAEDITKKKSFIVIDGKQRLLAIAGFVRPAMNFWDNPKLQGLSTRSDLNSKSYENLGPSDVRQLLNSDMRCTVISNYKKNDVLYDIFYRLNTGSVPLSSQELRQVLNKGPFADFLIEATDDALPLHKILNLEEPDVRLRDAEILLRYIAFSKFGRQRYEGNLTSFLAGAMSELNKNWSKVEKEIRALLTNFNAACERLQEVLGEGKVGRKYIQSGWESRFNKALFEVEVYYFSKLPNQKISAAAARNFLAEFKRLSVRSEFRESIESTTKTPERYRTRFELFRKMVNSSFKSKINLVPVPPEQKQ